MNRLRYLLLASLLIIAAHCMAQGRGPREDVVYLKNGSTYHGTIVEEVFNISLKIEDDNGQIHEIRMDQIARISKEYKIAAHPAGAAKPSRQTPAAVPSAARDSVRPARADQPAPAMPRGRSSFVYPRRGYYFQAQLFGGLLAYGVHIVNGYKFGQFGMLGLSVGFDGVAGGLPVGDFTRGYYFPVAVHYSGDILSRRHVTPCYAVELGYSFRYDRGEAYYLYITPADHQSVRTPGGVSGSVAFGFKVYSKKKFYIGLLADAELLQYRSRYDYSYYDGYQTLRVRYRSSQFMAIPGLKLIMGF